MDIQVSWYSITASLNHLQSCPRKTFVVLHDSHKALWESSLTCHGLRRYRNHIMTWQIVTDWNLFCGFEAFRVHLKLYISQLLHIASTEYNRISLTPFSWTAGCRPNFCWKSTIKDSVPKRQTRNRAANDHLLEPRSAMKCSRIQRHANVMQRLYSCCPSLHKSAFALAIAAIGRVSPSVGAKIFQSTTLWMMTP